MKIKIKMMLKYLLNKINLNNNQKFKRTLLNSGIKKGNYQD